MKYDEGCNDPHPTTNQPYRYCQLGSKALNCVPT